MKSISFVLLFLVSSATFGQDVQSSGGSDNNHGVYQGCEGNGCQYSSPSSRRRARQRFREEEAQNLEQMENRDKPTINVRPPEDTL